MNRRWASLLCLTSSIVAAPAFAQPAVDELEKQLRDSAAESDVRVAKQPPAEKPRPEPGYLGLIADDRDEQGAGVRIVDVLPGGPSDSAGLRRGDLVTGIDGKTVRSMQDFANRLSIAPPGAKVGFQIERGEQRKEIEITLGNRPPPDARKFNEFGRIPEAPAEPGAGPGRPSPALLGLRVVPVNEEARLALRLPSARGALVVDVSSGSAAQKASIPVEAVIVAVEGKRVDIPDDLIRMVTEAGPGATVKLAYYSKGELYERKITLGTADMPRADAPAGAAPPNPFGAGLPGEADLSRVEVLERRIIELERRLMEMERALRAQLAPPADAPRPESPAPAP